jgi:alkaline phosphatase D
MVSRWLIKLAALAGSILAGPVLASAQHAEVKPVASITGLPRRIAFGSCAHQNKPQPVLETVASRKPDLFVYLGDNIYADTRDMNVLREKYALLAAKPEFQRLRRQIPVVAIWDDHDYGENDAGKNYPFKVESRAIFFDFWRVPADSPRRSHDGIYGVHRFQQDGRTLQLILLDTRTFRDPLLRNPKSLPGGSPFKNDYQPDDSADKTFLGDDQWAWLKTQFLEPADLRIIASSIQFGHEYNGFESWTNFPREQTKMIDLIRETRANGVVFLSGDVHWAELSRRELPGGYPLYDITASGITETWPKIEPNQYRVGEVVPENHFGEIEVDWAAVDPVMHFRVINRMGTVRLEHAVALSGLRFSSK